MRAVHGTPKGDPPVFPDLHLSTLCEVDVIEALPGGGYRVHYAQRRAGRLPPFDVGDARTSLGPLGLHFATGHALDVSVDEGSRDVRNKRHG